MIGIYLMNSFMEREFNSNNILRNSN